MSEIINTATIKVVADTSEVEVGMRKIESAAAKTTRTLDNLGQSDGLPKVEAAAAKTARTLDSLGQSNGLRQMGAGAETSARQVDVAQRSLIASIQRTASAMEAGSRSSSSYYETLARQRGIDPAILTPYLNQLRAVEAAQARANATITRAAPALERVGITAGQTAAALRGVPAQFTDIVTSLQGGQSAITVLLQQGGQLKDMFGGAGAAAKALGGFVVGLVNPFTVAAAAAGTLGLAYFQGSSEARAFQSAITLSGNAAGTTAGQLADMAKAISQTVGTQGAAAEAIAQVVGTGRISARNILEFSEVAVKAQRALGQSVADTANEFASLAKDPLKGLEALNEKYHFLTGSVYEQVKALQDQGRASDAAEAAQRAYAASLDEISGKVVANLGLFARGWKSAGDAAKGAWDSFLDIGRAETDSEKLGRLTTRIANLQDDLEKRRARTGTTDDSVTRQAQANLDILLKEQYTYQSTAIEVRKSNEAKAAQVKLDEARVGWLKESEKYLTKQERLEREVAAARTQGVAAQMTQANIEARVASIRDKYKDTNAAAQISKEASGYASLISSIREKIAANELELTSGLALSDSQKASIKLDQELASGKIKLTDAHVESARGAIAELAAVELLNKARAGEKNTFDFIVKSTQARLASRDALESEYALYGKSADMREIANIALKNEAELQQHLADQTLKKIPISEEGLAQLRREIDLRTEVAQSTLAQSKALAYAAQLKTINAKDGAEAISDPVARAKALLDIEAKTWQERIQLAAEGTEARKVLESEYATWFENQSKKSYLTADVAGATQLLVIMSALDDVAKSAAQGMEQAFGKVGKSIGGMTTALSGFGKAQAAIEADRVKALSDARGDPVKIIEAETKAAQASSAAQIREYADLTDAAQGFFEKGSKGYKTLDAASKVLHAAEIARALASIAPSMTAGAAKLFGQGGWAGFAGVAAMAAVVAGFGVAVSGGSSTGGPSAEEVQKTQGSGTVFGATNAKSDSIAKSLALIEKNTYQGLDYSAGMLDALRNIEASMTGLSNLVTRATGVTDGSNLGIKTGQLNAAGSPTDAISRVMTNYLNGLGTLSFLTNPITNFINNLWGKVTADIVDSGIKFGGSVNDLQAGKGYQQYASVNTTKSSWFGLSKNTSNSVQTQGLSNELASQFGLIFTSLEETLKVAAVGMGIGADSITKTLDHLVLSTTTLSLKDLKGDDLTAAISAVISKAMDEISTAAFPSFEQFRKIGEGYAETVIRVATDFQAINTVFESFGKVFGQVGVASVGARERLIEMSGGLEKFVSQGEFFLKNFFTDGEQAAALKKRIQPTLTQYGLTTDGADATKMFRDFVVALDTTTEAGAKAYVALQAIAPAFVDIVKASSAALDERRGLQDQLDALTLTSAQMLTKQRNALDASNRALFDQVQAATAAKAAQDAAKTSLGEVINKMKSFGDSAKSLRDGLLTGALTTLTPQQQYEETKRQYQATLAAAKTGDATAQTNFSAIANAFLTASQKINGGDTQYQTDFSGVLQTTDDLSKWALGQVDVAQASLDALNKQVLGINAVGQAVWALPEALANAIDFSGMGTTNMAPLVDEIKALREEVKTLRLEQAAQTGDLITSNVQANLAAASNVVTGVAETAEQTSWSARNGNGRIQAL